MAIFYQESEPGKTIYLHDSTWSVEGEGPELSCRAHGLHVLGAIFNYWHLQKGVGNPKELLSEETRVFQTVGQAIPGGLQTNFRWVLIRLNIFNNINVPLWWYATAFEKMLQSCTFKRLLRICFKVNNDSKWGLLLWWHYWSWPHFQWVLTYSHSK